VKRELEEKRTERRQQKADKWKRELDDWRYKRDKTFLEQILKDVPLPGLCVSMHEKKEKEISESCSQENLMSVTNQTQKAKVTYRTARKL
jgi:hypothetical protein